MTSSQSSPTRPLSLLLPSAIVDLLYTFTYLSCPLFVTTHPSSSNFHLSTTTSTLTLLPPLTLTFDLVPLPTVVLFYTSVASATPPTFLPPLPQSTPTTSALSTAEHRAHFAVSARANTKTLLHHYIPFGAFTFLRLL